MSVTAMMLALGGAKMISGSRSKRASAKSADAAIERAYEIYEYNLEQINEAYDENVSRLITQSAETIDNYTTRKMEQLGNTAQSFATVSGVNLAESSMPVQSLSQQLEETNQGVNTLIRDQAMALEDLARRKEQQVTSLTYQIENIDQSIMNGLERAEQQANAMMISGLINVGVGAYGQMAKTPKKTPTQTTKDYYDYVDPTLQMGYTYV
jgi:hypothetical protein